MLLGLLGLIGVVWCVTHAGCCPSRMGGARAQAHAPKTQHTPFVLLVEEIKRLLELLLRVLARQLVLHVRPGERRWVRRTEARVFFELSKHGARDGRV